MVKIKIKPPWNNEPLEENQPQEILNSVGAVAVETKAKSKDWKQIILDLFWRIKFWDELYLFELFDVKPRVESLKDVAPEKDRLVTRPAVWSSSQVIPINYQQITRIRSLFWEFLSVKEEIEPVSEDHDINLLLAGKFFILERDFHLVLELCSGMYKNENPLTVLRTMYQHLDEISREKRRIIPFSTVDIKGQRICLCQGTSDNYVNRLTKLVTKQLGILEGASHTTESKGTKTGISETLQSFKVKNDFVGDVVHQLFPLLLIESEEDKTRLKSFIETNIRSGAPFCLAVTVQKFGEALKMLKIKEAFTKGTADEISEWVHKNFVFPQPRTGKIIPVNEKTIKRAIEKLHLTRFIK